MVANLEKIFKISAGGDIERKNFSKEWSEEFSYPVYANALTNSGLYGFANYYKVEGNSITVTGRGDVGHAIARYNKYVPIVRLLTLIPKNKINVLFFENAINSTKIFVESTGVPQLTSPQLGAVKIHYPYIEEQDKIAAFLSLIDERIAKQRQLVENLKKYKRGLFVQLYNQSAKNKIQIKNLGEYFSAGILSKEDIVENGSNPCILYGELFTKYNEVIQEVYSSTNKNILSKTIGTEILFPSSTTVDALSLICPSSINQKDIILGGDLFAIKLKKDFDNDFMSYLFNYIYKRLLAKFAQGITIVHLHYSDIKEQFIEVPSIQEQIKIIKIINNIEIYILKNEKIYEQLKFIKQGLLQQMFI